MARKVARVRKNKDGTTTVRAGGHVEHFSAHLSKGELWDAVKLSLYSKGISMSDNSLLELMREVTEG